MLDIILCEYCRLHGALVVPVILPEEIAAPVFDHLPDCPIRIVEERIIEENI